MYWNNNSVASSHLEILLSKKDVTLQELMDEEEVLQECKSQNKRLIEYLIRSDVLEELVTLTTVEPAGDDYSKYKYPNIACELLTCEVPQLNERLAKDKALMGKLYSFLESNAPLNPLLASFFSKTFSVLIGRNHEQNWYSYQLTCLQVLEFLKSKENCVDLLLKHLGTSAIMELLFKLITEVDGKEMKQNILNWLDDQKLVQKIVALFDPSMDSDVHCNASQLLSAVLISAREKRKQDLEQDPILDRIQSPETVNLLLDQILKTPKCETSITGGITVLLTLLEDDRRETNDGNGAVVEDHSSDTTEPSEVVLSTVKAILPRLKDFHDLLLNPPVKPAVNTTIGLIDPPLGNTRVEVAKLLSVLVANNNFDVNKELAQLGTINILLDLFFKYIWNNFLHAEVEHCLAFALNSDVSLAEGSETQNNVLIAHILVECRLLQRILDAWEDNEVQQNVHKRPRRGYMGHLIKIANNIVEQTAKGLLGALLTEIVDYATLSKWDAFVATKLAEINDMCSVCLGGLHPKEIVEGINQSLEMYSSYYQLQALEFSHYNPEGFGSFQEEQFNDNEEVLGSMNESIVQKLGFEMKDKLDQIATSYERFYNQSYPALDDDDIDILHKKVETRSDDNLKSDWPETLENSSSDEDEPQEHGGPGRDDNQAQFEALSSWPSEAGRLIPTLSSTSPWDAGSLASPNMGATANSSSPDLGWANFESAPFVDDFSLNLSPDISTTIATVSAVTPSDAESTPLDLTPNDNNISVNEFFLQGDSMVAAGETPALLRAVDSAPNIDSITNAVNDLELRASDDAGKVAGPESVPSEGDARMAGPNEGAPAETHGRSRDDIHCSPDLVGDVNGSRRSDKDDLIDNFRFLSSQGLMTKYGQNSDLESESSSGDGYKLLQENVQSVPNDSNQSSNKNVDVIESRNPPVTTTNGPV